MGRLIMGIVGGMGAGANGYVGEMGAIHGKYKHHYQRLHVYVA